ncbi:MAG: hypothetical protein JKY18_10130 [Flavobacteriales bacterium]|nr:hypothetical protein [Flavobacteriales bacterium]
MNSYTVNYDSIILKVRAELLILLTCVGMTVSAQVDTSRGYFPDGQLKFEYPTLNGQYHGFCQQWYPGGQLKITGYFDNGKVTGNSKHYYESGAISYDNDLKKDVGITRAFFEDGRKKHYAVNEPNSSVSKVWNENGKMILKTVYKNGFGVSCMAQETASGPVKETCSYNGIQVFLKDSLYVDSVGTPVKYTESYSSKEFYDNGRKKSKMVIKKGKGVQMAWDENGKLTEKKKIYSANRRWWDANPKSNSWSNRATSLN